MGRSKEVVYGPRGGRAMKGAHGLRYCVINWDPLSYFLICYIACFNLLHVFIFIYASCMQCGRRCYALLANSHY